LRREARDHGQERCISLIGKAERAPELFFAGAFQFETVLAIVVRQVGICPGIPLMVIDTVENADEIGGALAQHAFEAKTLLGAHNFPCVRRAHGAELIGKNKRAFEKIDIAVKFQKLRRKKARIEIQQTPIGWPEDSLKAEIVNRKNRFCRGQFG
jgi:hypothetical protein